ncbi:hypothetical protein LINPERPRIM_LOCUS34544 [Linum perenne]
MEEKILPYCWFQNALMAPTMTIGASPCSPHSVPRTKSLS